MIELGKLDTKVVFRPELDTEFAESQNSGQMQIRVETPTEAAGGPSDTPAIFSAVTKLDDE